MAYDRLLPLNDDSKAFTFKAGRVISGGQLVGFSSGTDVCASGGNFAGYAFGDILVDSGSVGSQNFVGIAMQTVAANDPVNVLMEGMYVLPVGANAIVGGELLTVIGNGSNFVGPYTGSDAAFKGTIVGRALSAGTANTGFVLVKLI
jgi:hypothetical protein